MAISSRSLDTKRHSKGHMLLSRGTIPRMSVIEPRHRPNFQETYPPSTTGVPDGEKLLWPLLDALED